MTQKENNHTTPWELIKFDPIVLVMDVAKRWLLILLVVLIAGMGAYVFKTASYKPEYNTNITYVTCDKNDSSSVYSNLMAANSVASVFEELLNSSLLRKTILQESGLAYFDGSIKAMVIPETNLINIVVSGGDSRSVFLVAQAIVEHHGTVTYQVIDNVTLELLRNPIVPMAPSNIPNTMGFVKKAVLLAGAAVVMVLGYLSFMANKVRSAREAQSKLDCGYLGEVPHQRRYASLKAFLQRKQTSILVTNPVTGFRFVENFRKLAGRVEYHMHGKKVIMITSVMEDEGKSTVAMNLAMSMALKHEKVLLIDCDLRKPACHLLAEQEKVAHGLRHVLDGEATLEQALITDKKSGLYMLLETQATQDSDDYLSGKNMHRLLQQAREQFDIVVLDLPPMALVSNAESVMEIADASVLVVRQNGVPAPGINKAIDTLKTGKAKLLGCVLNNVYSSGLMTDSYGYGYGKSSAYGHYGSYGHYGKYGRYGRYDRYDPEENKD